ncbi:MAG: zinc-binding dehydrogenase [Candidatus Hydrogenedens sp.]|nr:zinc-binding dehydrogenase [Candidatus Hydrogenedens sp.]
MKALVFERYGKADEVLELRDIPEPQPGPGEVKVKMLYSPMNPSDIVNTVEGAYRDAVGRAIWNLGRDESAYTIDPQGERKLPPLPHVPGLEGVGVVVDAGAGLYPRMLVGKRVTVVGARKGNWQEYNITEAKLALPVKRGISDEQAAVSFVNPVTAYAMVRDVLQCGPGDLVLQSAGNSELGKMIARLGKRLGYQTISIVRDKAQAAHLLSLGAAHVIDISTENLRKRVHEITRGQGVKYALDPISGPLANEMVQCLGLGGRLLVYGTLSTEPLQFSSRDLMTPLSSVEGYFLTNWMAGKSLLQKLSVTRKVAALVQDGTLQSDIRQVFPLEQYKEAMAALKEPGNQGKILLKLT